MKGKFDDWILVVMFVKMFALGINFQNHTMNHFLIQILEMLSFSKKDWEEITKKHSKKYLKIQQ
jgi:hypothetical protein